jgi:hypothetical protein
MRRASPAVAAALLLAACDVTPPPEPQRQVVAGGAWACRERNVTMDLLFLGTSGAFENQLAHALSEGICVYLAGDETVSIVQRDPAGLIRVRRETTKQTAWWTPTQNLR